jgi:hypothetical protein
MVAGTVVIHEVEEQSVSIGTGRNSRGHIAMWRAGADCATQNQNLMLQDSLVRISVGAER